MGRVLVGVEETHRYRLDVRLLEASERGAQVVLVERLEYLPGVIDPFRHLEPTPPRCERLRWIPQDVVQLTAVVTSQLEHVAKATRGDETRLRAGSRDHGVGRRGGAVMQLADVAPLERRRRRRNFSDPNLSVPDCDDVGERAAGVNANPPTPSGTRTAAFH